MTTPGAGNKVKPQG
jgi:hypothetical protein